MKMLNKMLKRFSKIENTCYNDELIYYFPRGKYYCLLILEDSYESIKEKYYSFVNHSDTLSKKSSYIDNDQLEIIKTPNSNQLIGYFTIQMSDFEKTLKNQCSHFLRWKCDCDGTEDEKAFKEAVEALYKERRERSIFLEDEPCEDVKPIVNGRLFNYYRIDEKILEKALTV